MSMNATDWLEACGKWVVSETGQPAMVVGIVTGPTVILEQLGGSARQTIGIDGLTARGYRVADEVGSFVRTGFPPEKRREPLHLAAMQSAFSRAAKVGKVPLSVRVSDARLVTPADGEPYYEVECVLQVRALSTMLDSAPEGALS